MNKLRTQLGYNQGFTVLTPAADSRLIYVATDGDDAQAANNQHGRRYYLPSDPEIGGDPQLPAQPQNIKAYATISAAVVPFRGDRWISETNNVDDYGRGWDLAVDRRAGHPDWLLFRRGQTFPTEDFGVTIGGQFISQGNTDLGTALRGHGTNGEVGYYMAGSIVGRSENERAVVTAWGTSDSEPRPIVGGYLSVGYGMRNVAVTSLDMPVGLGGVTDPRPWDDNRIGVRDVIIEDCSNFGGAANGAPYTNVLVRRCQRVDTFKPSAHNQGLFINEGRNANRSLEPYELTLEECIFDRNGYKENVNEPTTWTRGIKDEALMAPGTGFQPRRTFFDRNIYAARYASLTIRGCIFSRGGGGGSVQMREGGVAERNLFIWNEDAGFSVSGNGGYLKDNVVLHDDHFLPPGGHGKGFGHWNFGNGNTDGPYLYVSNGNVIAHFHRNTHGAKGTLFTGDFAPDGVTYNPGSVYFIDNVIHHKYGATGLAVKSASAPMVTATGNEVAVADARVFSGPTYALVLAGGMDYAINGNFYHSTASTPFGNNDKTFAQWQATRSDLDDSSTFTSDFASFASSVGWTDPDRDILSYMQSVDPTYVVNEDVYVDDGTTGIKQTPRQKVWEALTSDVDYGNIPEARAKEIARRYHAFLAFIEKARNNRKGAWDTRWTADAVNNYIREGFGRPPLAGPYTTYSPQPK